AHADRGFASLRLCEMNFFPFSAIRRDKESQIVQSSFSWRPGWSVTSSIFKTSQKAKVKSQKFGAGANCCAQLRGIGEFGKLKEAKPCLAKTQGAQRKQRGFFARFAPLRDNFVFSPRFLGHL